MRDHVAEKINEISSDNQSGAAALTVKACEALQLLTESLRGQDSESVRRELKEFSDKLLEAQPDMAPLVSLGHQVGKIGKVDQAADLADTFQKKLKEAASRIPVELLQIINNDAVVLTYSNSSSVRNALINCHEMGRSFRVACTESRPGYEGRALARDLGRAGIPCDLAVDAASLQLLKSAGLVLIGADAVTEGHFVNKIGTYALALGAREYSRECYVLTDTTKFVHSDTMGHREKSHPSKEVLSEEYPNVRTLNPYFEKVPLNLASGFITEKGIVSPKQVSGILFSE